MDLLEEKRRELSSINGKIEMQKLVMNAAKTDDKKTSVDFANERAQIDLQIAKLLKRREEIDSREKNVLQGVSMAQLARETMKYLESKRESVLADIKGLSRKKKFEQLLKEAKRELAADKNSPTAKILLEQLKQMESDVD